MSGLALALLTLALDAPSETPTAPADPPPARPALVATGTAFEAPRALPRFFGEAGTVVLDDLLGLGFGPAVGTGALGQVASAPMMTGWLRYADLKLDQGGTSFHITTLALAPSLDVFVARNVSLGAQLSLFHTSLRSGSVTSVVGGGLTPRIGWTIPITDGLYFWPRFFGTIQVMHADAEGTDAATQGATSVIGGGKQTGIGWGFGADAMLVAPLGRAVALTFGPTVEYGKADVLDAPQQGTTTTISLGVHGGIALTL